MNVTSVCVKCEHQHSHGVNNDGRATVKCPKCGVEYDVRSYEVRAKGGKRSRKTGVKAYSIRVKEPDRDEGVLEFNSRQEIEMRAGDWITGSYNKHGLKYLLNHKIKRFWDVQQGMAIGGSAGLSCAVIVMAVLALIWFFGECRGPRKTERSSVTTSQVGSFAPTASAVRLVIDGGYVNVREGPGTEYGIIGKVDRSSKISVLAISPDGFWHRIRRSDGLEGWIFKSYGQIEPKDAKVPAWPDPIAPPEEPPTPVPTKAPPKKRAAAAVSSYSDPCGHGRHWVSGYTRKNGVRVSGHCRSNPS